jgi:hypothetical protein
MATLWVPEKEDRALLGDALRLATQRALADSSPPGNAALTF